MNDPWRFIDTGASSPFFNMALDEALFLSSSETSKPILRVFDWSKPSISTGYFQDPRKTLNVDFCKKEGIDIVRRITGGRAVYHENEITYSIVIPSKSRFFKNNNLELYRVLSDGLLLGLRTIGLHVNLVKPKKGRSEYQNRGNCFSSTSAYEITVDGKKIVGSAQKWTKRGVLQQGSILLGMDLKRINQIFNRGHVCKNFDTGFTTMFEILNYIPERGSIIRSLLQGFKEALGISIIESKTDERELNLASYLLEKKYSTDDWNFNKINPCKRLNLNQ